MYKVGRISREVTLKVEKNTKVGHADVLVCLCEKLIYSEWQLEWIDDRVIFLWNYQRHEEINKKEAISSWLRAFDIAYLNGASLLCLLNLDWTIFVKPVLEFLEIDIILSRILRCDEHTH